MSFKKEKWVESESESRSVVSDSLWPHGLYSPWNSPSQNTGVVAVPFSRGSSQPMEWTQVSCTAGRFFISWATRETGYIHFYKTWIRKKYHKEILQNAWLARWDYEWDFPPSLKFHKLLCFIGGKKQLPLLYIFDRKRINTFLQRPWTPPPPTPTPSSSSPIPLLPSCVSSAWSISSLVSRLTNHSKDCWSRLIQMKST